MDANDIKESLKKYFYTGVSLASHSADALQKSINQLINEGRMNEADGRRIVADAIRKVEERRPEIEAQYNRAVHQFVKVTATEIGKLQKKVKQMEKQLQTKSAVAVKAAAKVTRKTKAKAPARKRAAR